jgi:hypothetical protein
MTANCVRGLHIQSMILGTDKDGLTAMYNDGSFGCPGAMPDAWGQEVGLTHKLQGHGWEFNAWMVRIVP